MELASGLCHYCTMGLPPEKLFYLYIPIGCLDSSLLLRVRMRETVDIGGRSLQCLYNGLHFCVTFLFRTASCLDRRAITWRQQATYCVETPFLRASLDGWSLSSMFPCLFGPNKAMFCIYI